MHILKALAARNLSVSLFLSFVYVYLFWHLGRMMLVGEEHNILYHGISFYLTGKFCIHDPDFFYQWAQKVGSMCHHLNSWTPCRPANVILSGILQSPFAYLWGETGARALTAFISLLGSMGFYKLLKYKNRPHAFAITLLTVTTIPVISYIKLAYTESWLYTLFIWAWYLNESHAQKTPRIIWAFMVALSIPVFHLRPALLAPALFFFLLKDLWIADKNPLWKKLYLPFFCGLMSVVIFVSFNLWAYGAIAAGGAVSDYPLWYYPIRLAYHLFDFRHGLIPYAPLSILGIWGLILGVKQKDPFAMKALIFFLIYTFFSVWAQGGESHSGRYWVAILPAIMVGVSYWIETLTRKNIRSQILFWGFSFFILTIHVLLLQMFLENPDLYFHNRQYSYVYDILFQKTGFLHLGAYLPLDDFIRRDHPAYSYELQRALLAFLLFFISCALIVFRQTCSKKLSQNLSLGALVVLFAYLLLAHSFYEIPQSRFQISSHITEDNRNHLEVRFKKPTPLSMLRIAPVQGHVWFPPHFPLVWQVSSDKDESKPIPVRSVSFLRTQNRVQKLLLIDDPPRDESFKDQYWQGKGILFYASHLDRFLTRLVGFME